MVILAASLASVTCADFDSTIYNNALDAIIAEATFSESLCADMAELTDDGATQVEITTEVTVPLAELHIYADDTITIMGHVMSIVTAAASDGSFQTQIQYFAGLAGRRLDMTSISVQGVSVDT